MTKESNVPNIIIVDPKSMPKRPLTDPLRKNDAVTNMFMARIAITKLNANDMPVGGYKPWKYFANLFAAIPIA